MSCHLVTQQLLALVWQARFYYGSTVELIHKLAVYPRSERSEQNTTDLGLSPIDLYMIKTKKGTPLSKFQDWIQALDGGVGTSIAYDTRPHQSYVTQLNETEVADIKQLDFIQRVTPLQHPDHPSNRMMFSDEVQTNRGFSQRHLKARDIVPQKNDIPQLGILSNYANDGEEYLADESLGKGTTIFVVDIGFNLDVKVRSICDPFLRGSGPDHPVYVGTSQGRKRGQFLRRSKYAYPTWYRALPAITGGD